MRLAHQFQRQTVKGQGYRRAGVYRVVRTRRPHCLFLFIFLFLLATTHDRRADAHQIFQENGKWFAIERLSFWFLNSFWVGRKVQKWHFRFVPSLKMQHGGKTDLGLLIEKKKLCNFGRIISLPNVKCRPSLENLSRDPSVHFVYFWARSRRLATLPICHRSMLIIYFICRSMTISVRLYWFLFLPYFTSDYNSSYVLFHLIYYAPPVGKGQ